LWWVIDRLAASDSHSPRAQFLEPNFDACSTTNAPRNRPAVQASRPRRCEARPEHHDFRAFAMNGRSRMAAAWRPAAIMQDEMPLTTAHGA
jgi:hypothetical protein